MEKAISIRGLNRLARDLNLTHQALRRWQRQRRLPRTEWTGETAYAKQIATVTANAVTEAELMATPWPMWPAAGQEGAGGVHAGRA